MGRNKRSEADSKEVKNYRELNVYKLAFESTTKIFELSKNWPKEEKYSLIDQIRRSSISVCSNIAEAWRKRKYPAHFASKLSDSDGESAETEVWLDFALECGYIDKDYYKELHDSYNHICAMLTKMISNADSWCVKRK